MTSFTSDNYAGLIFWDAETWMYPSLLLMHPDLAESIVASRQNLADGMPGLVHELRTGFRERQILFQDGR